MKVFFGILCVYWNIIGLHFLIIPDELPSILSVIYSNIPTLKKGTDSRIGWGFRLGERADFQILLELGPQLNTQPLANQKEDDNTNKRQTLNNLANTLYAQRQQEKKEKLEENKNTSKSQGEDWLKSWSKSVSKEGDATEVQPNIQLEARPGIAVGEIDAKSVIPDDSVLEKIEKLKLNSKIQKTHNKGHASKKISSTTPSLVAVLTNKDTKSEQGDLDDVSLE